MNLCNLYLDISIVNWELTNVPAIFFLRNTPPPPNPRGSLMTGVLDSISGPAGLHSDHCNAYHILPHSRNKVISTFCPEIKIAALPKQNSCNESP